MDQSGVLAFLKIIERSLNYPWIFWNLNFLVTLLESSLGTEPFWAHSECSVGPEPRPVCMKCPLTFSTILSSTSSEVFRDTRCLSCWVRHFAPHAPKGRQVFRPRFGEMAHRYAVPPGMPDTPRGSSSQKTFKLRGPFMHTGPPCGTRLVALVSVPRGFFSYLIPTSITDRTKGAFEGARGAI